MRISQSLSGCGLACQRLYFQCRSPFHDHQARQADPYTLTIDGEGLKLVEKGRRNGQEVRWRDLVSGDTALSAALNASTGG